MMVEWAIIRDILLKGADFILQNLHVFLKKISTKNVGIFQGKAWCHYFRNLKHNSQIPDQSNLLYCLLFGEFFRSSRGGIILPATIASSRKPVYILTDTLMFNCMFDGMLEIKIVGFYDNLMVWSSSKVSSAKFSFYRTTLLHVNIVNRMITNITS